MKAAPEPRELFTASQVAAFCAVDLKTIHNWAERGELRHFRTPGRHLRFRRGDVAEFLAKYGYAVPDELIAGKPRVYVLDTDGGMQFIKRALGKDFEVTTFQDWIDALVAIGIDVPECIVLDVAAETFDGMHCLARLKRLPATRDIPLVVFCAKAGLGKKALEAGASAFVAKADVDRLVSTLTELLGHTSV